MDERRLISNANKTCERISSNPQETLFPGALISRKQEFLHKLRGKGRKYKRYLGSPLRYAGGKTWAVGFVLEHLPENINRLKHLEKLTAK